MFRKMRRKDREMSIAMAEKILFSNKTAVISTIGDDGYPYGVPLNYVCEKQNEHFFVYFHGAVVGHKIDAVKANDKVSLCVIERDEVIPDEFSTNFSSVIAFGRAEVVNNADERIRALKLLTDKYSYEYADRADSYIHKYESKSAVSVVKISIEHITGKERKG